jgi:hypothetical protein
MKIDLKKYEYEVELMHENEHLKTDNFIYGLHSSAVSNPQARLISY